MESVVRFHHIECNQRETGTNKINSEKWEDTNIYFTEVIER